VSDSVTERLRAHAGRLTADEEIEAAKERMRAEQELADARIRESLERQAQVARDLEQARREARDEHDARLSEAQERIDVRQWEARKARTRANHARNAVTAYRRQHRARASRVHAAIDQASAQAGRELRAALGEAAAPLVLALEAGVPQSGRLPTLAGLYVAASEPFRQCLHELVDGGAIPAGAGLSDVTDDEFERRVSELKREQAEAEQDATEADTRLQDAYRDFREIQGY